MRKLSEVKLSSQGPAAGDCPSQSLTQGWPWGPRAGGRVQGQSPPASSTKEGLRNTSGFPERLSLLGFTGVCTEEAVSGFHLRKKKKKHKNPRVTEITSHHRTLGTPSS